MTSAGGYAAIFLQSHLYNIQRKEKQFEGTFISELGLQNVSSKDPAIEDFLLEMFGVSYYPGHDQHDIGDVRVKTSRTFYECRDSTAEQTGYITVLCFDNKSIFLLGGIWRLFEWLHVDDENPAVQFNIAKLLILETAWQPVFFLINHKFI